MFQDTLLIIKPDYLQKRKQLLVHLQNKGFMIKALKRIQFTPEDAAEFYGNKPEEQGFMLRVILLSKGVSEAFILAKENAIEQLINTIICYFTTSAEMEQYVHMAKDERSVRTEISFIFPNYIQEPILPLKTQNLQSDPLLPLIIEKMSQLSPPEANKSWKVQMAEWLLADDEELPIVSNKCSANRTLRSEEKGTQINTAGGLGAARSLGAIPKQFSKTSGSSTFPSTITTLGMTSSSCFSCGGLYSTDHSSDPQKMKDSVSEMFYRKVVSLPKQEKNNGEDIECMCIEVCEKYAAEYTDEMVAEDGEGKEVIEEEKEGLATCKGGKP